MYTFVENIMKKNIDLSKEAIKAITIQAVTEGTVFKLKAQTILEEYAKPLIKNDSVKKVKNN